MRKITLIIFTLSASILLGQNISDDLTFLGVGKVFRAGSNKYLSNSEDCEFYFECDCCMDELLFISKSEFYFISYCQGDIDFTKGNYEIRKDGLILSSDGKLITRKYNWEREIHPKAIPSFFIKDTTMKPYKVDFKIRECNGVQLIDEEYIAIETDLSIEKKILQLKEYGLFKD